MQKNIFKREFFCLPLLEHYKLFIKIECETSTQNFFYIPKYMQAWTIIIYASHFYDRRGKIISFWIHKEFSEFIYLRLSLLKYYNTAYTISSMKKTALQLWKRCIKYVSLSRETYIIYNSILEHKWSSGKIYVYLFLV